MTDGKKTEMNPDELKKLNGLKQLIADLDDLPSPTFAEKNFFNIGGRGYYENPTSDVLAFFCHTEGEHGLGDLVVRALFNALASKKLIDDAPSGGSDSSNSQVLKQHIPSDLSTIDKPRREVSTWEGNRIDLLLEGNDWVMVIENKIYHHQESNPFEDYKGYIQEEKASIEESKRFFVVLSPDGTAKDESNWLGLSYSDLVDQIKKELGQAVIDAPFNKWLVFLRDFIINLQEFTMTNPTPKETIEYVFNNVKAIREVEQTKFAALDSFMEEIRKEIAKGSSGANNTSLDLSEIQARISVGSGWKYYNLRYWLPAWKNSWVILYPDGKGDPSWNAENSSNASGKPMSIWVNTHTSNEDQYQSAISTLKMDGDKIEKSGGWLSIESGRRYSVDDKDAIVAELIQRLERLYDYEKSK